MPYVLRVASVIQAVWDALPQDASAELTNAMSAVCADPMANTQPYGEDDGVMRMLTLRSAMVVLLVAHPTNNVHVLQITYAG